MGRETPKAGLDKETMKALREERKQWVDAAAANARETRKALKAIRGALEGDGATAPEVAAATGLETDKALWLLASMRKFGEVAEAGKDGDFYRYTLVGGQTPESGSAEAPAQ